MVAGAFPIAKLAVLAVRQVSKPLAKRIKEKAKSSHFFRTYICMPPAQIYHWLEVTVKMKMLNLGKPTEVPKLNETMAIELGAELLGETIIFGCAALTLTAEYIRQSRKESYKEAEQENRLKRLEQSIEYMRQAIEQQNSAIAELTKQYNEIKKKSIISKLIEGSTRNIIDTSNLENTVSNKSDSVVTPENQGLINNALFDVTSYFGFKPSSANEIKSPEEITYTGEPCFTCQVSSKLGLGYSVPQKMPVHETLHSRKETEKHDHVYKALADAVLIIRGKFKESSTLYLKEPYKERTMYANSSKYPRLPEKLTHSLLNDSIVNAKECIIGKKDTKKFEFDSQFLTSVDFAEDMDGNILYDFNLAEIADDAGSSILLGETNLFFSQSNKLPSLPSRCQVNKDSQVKSASGIFEQALHDAIGYIVKEKQNDIII